MNINTKSSKTYHLHIQYPLLGRIESLEIDFYDVDRNIASCFLQDITLYLINPTHRLIYDLSTNRDIKLPLNQGETPFICIDKERVICYMGIGSYLLGYLDPEERYRDKALFSQITSRNSYNQVPEIIASFDYGNRYYLVLDAETISNRKTNDIMFDGIIVNPKKYLEAERWLAPIL